MRIILRQLILLSFCSNALAQDLVLENPKAPEIEGACKAAVEPIRDDFNSRHRKHFIEIVDMLFKEMDPKLRAAIKSSERKLAHLRSEAKRLKMEIDLLKADSRDEASQAKYKALMGQYTSLGNKIRNEHNTIKPLWQKAMDPRTARGVDKVFHYAKGMGIRLSYTEGVLTYSGAISKSENGKHDIHLGYDATGDYLDARYTVEVGSKKSASIDGTEFWAMAHKDCKDTEFQKYALKKVGQPIGEYLATIMTPKIPKPGHDQPSYGNPKESETSRGAVTSK